MRHNKYYDSEVIKNKSLLKKKAILLIVIIWVLIISYLAIFAIGFNNGKKVYYTENSYLKKELSDVLFENDYRRTVNYTGNDDEMLKDIIVRKGLEKSINKYKNSLGIPESKTVPTKELLNYILIHSKKYGLDVYETTAQIAVESNFIIRAHSNADCKGLMQISKGTLQNYNCINHKNYSWEKDIYIPAINIEVGCWYMKHLKDNFNKKGDEVFYSYNAGPYGRKGIEESTNYVAKINNLKEEFKEDLNNAYF